MTFALVQGRKPRGLCLFLGLPEQIATDCVYLKAIDIYSVTVWKPRIRNQLRWAEASAGRADFPLEAAGDGLSGLFWVLAAPVLWSSSCPHWHTAFPLRLPPPVSSVFLSCFLRMLVIGFRFLWII